MRFGAWEIVLIIVLVLIVFGGSKLAGVGKSLGRGIKEFKEEVSDTDSKDKNQVNAEGESDEEKSDSKNKTE